MSKPSATSGPDLSSPRLPQTKPSLIAKSEDAMRERIAALDGTLAQVLVVDHAIDKVSAAIRELMGNGVDPVLVFGASAIVDRGDVMPAALVSAGGEVLHLGMPVDPGNLMMLGRLGDVPVIGVPSCARSPKLNGFDWVLARVMADVPVTRGGHHGHGGRRVCWPKSRRVHRRARAGPRCSVPRG